MSELDAALTGGTLTFTFDLEFFKVKLYLENGRPGCYGTKRTGVDRMSWLETQRKWVNWTLRWLGYLWHLPLTLNSQGQIVSQEWKARLSWNKKGWEWIGCSSVKHNHYVTLRQRVLLRTGVIWNVGVSVNSSNCFRFLASLIIAILLSGSRFFVSNSRSSVLLAFREGGLGLWSRGLGRFQFSLSLTRPFILFSVVPLIICYENRFDVLFCILQPGVLSIISWYFMTVHYLDWSGLSALVIFWLLIFSQMDSISSVLFPRLQLYGCR